MRRGGWVIELVVSFINLKVLGIGCGGRGECKGVSFLIYILYA